MALGVLPNDVWDNVSVPEYYALFKHWEEFPPIHIAFAMAFRTRSSRPSPPPAPGVKASPSTSLVDALF